MVIAKLDPVPGALNGCIDQGLYFRGSDEKQGEAKSKSPFSVWKTWG